MVVSTTSARSVDLFSKKIVEPRQMPGALCLWCNGASLQASMLDSFHTGAFDFAQICVKAGDILNSVSLGATVSECDAASSGA